MGCCEHTKNSSSCHDDGGSKKTDKLFLTLCILGAFFYFGHLVNVHLSPFASGQLEHLFHAFFELINTMYWGVLLGIVFVGLLGRVPRDFVISILGKSGTLSSLFRATGAGLLLDLCSHGILMVGMKLYERGASTGQVMAFLIASPWNSLSLTLVLFALVGIKWTLIFIFLSAIIAVLTGIVFDWLEKNGKIPPNPNTVSVNENFNFRHEFQKGIKSFDYSAKNLVSILLDGIKDSKMIVKWLLLGAVLASLIQVFVGPSTLQEHFGPTIWGLFMTLLATTIIEVCSEGSTPIAADLLNRAAAPGNAFTFLMAGVATDYTEILSVKSTTKSWKIALLIPLITVPQVLVIGYILNQWAP